MPISTYQNLILKWYSYVALCIPVANKSKRITILKSKENSKLKVPEKKMHYIKRKKNNKNKRTWRKSMLQKKINDKHIHV